MNKTSSLFLLLVIFLCACGNKQNENYLNIKGKIFGTYYSITYLHPQQIDLTRDVENVWKEFDNSLSTFNPNSIISRINKNDTSVVTDAYFNEMYRIANTVSSNTEGAFDITVAPLVNSWGFGTSSVHNAMQPNVDSLLQFVGYEKIKLEKGKLKKNDTRIMLDANAIAKGQACDITAKLLEEKGCENFMVEIGGEIVCKGLNPQGKTWKLGIDIPIEDPVDANKELDTIVSITNVGMATSGNYRQFYYRDGKKYAHTINPQTGFPVQHTLLSATVIAPSCIEADAYATAFMVLGVEKSLSICNSLKDVSCYLIAVDKDGKYVHHISDNFVQYLRK